MLRKARAGFETHRVTLLRACNKTLTRYEPLLFLASFE